ncbi:[FeFe] hydrogenase H-cluster maturation GTPase HydF [Candidatus Galacturonibacter soehngenii]|uniref:[FeFe] hydrogenase H-cluster maturation GTPase HydF n=1 Tax=Candidatus Galacturonatibacter soehngenii TaxID=2307010 RepID=A0A7V7UGZ5_9FIRM|nr:[FeFe] hydrogenase H-cluster maturation GTPase HydF [Candidatus Galacturonibacter soehngenii]KAB1439468.1 [FeFe] hydrogenase H-cluster maturation GTPase HydF [Candidatus Galacturonibacter soehngenii]
MSLTNTPRSNQLHIGIYGKRNSGKSSLINAITSQDIALVSEIAGTTTDPVYKTMEISGIGPCVFIDTAGFDDEGELGNKRIERTNHALTKTDIAIVVFTDTVCSMEKVWVEKLNKAKIPFIPVVNKVDILENLEEVKDVAQQITKRAPILISCQKRIGMEDLLEELRRNVPEDYEANSIVGHLVNEGDIVLLVMPQDMQAPKGRLILPQVQTLRDLLDLKCIVLSATTDRLEESLQALSKPPALIITDSQVFQTVYEKKPKESRLTSFSVLFARYKGDIDYYVESANAFSKLTENSKVLIAEACTHAPLAEDIGREKIPRMLRKRVGDAIDIQIVSGVDFPKDLSGYDLIIQCGSCMFNRRYMLSRVKQAKKQNVPMTNYGITIAYMSGILDKIDY